MDFMKKGVILTILSLLVASFFILMFSADIEVPLDSQAGVVSFRVGTLAQFKNVWEDYVSNSLRSSSYAALARMSDYVDTNNQFFQLSGLLGFSSNFEECMMNGTLIRGLANCSGNGLTNNYTFSYWLDSLANVALSDLNINTTYTVNGVEAYQEFPFLVTVEANMSYKIVDVFATIERNYTVKEYVPIEGIRDPFMGRFFDPPESNRFITETGILDSQWNKGNLSAFINDKEYRYRASAPSLLMRFIGDYSGSACCGVEAVLSEIVDGIPPASGYMSNASFVDYLYFQDYSGGGPVFNCDEVFEVIGISGTQIDQEHLASFNVSASQWVTVC